ncbi:UDP-N-acetylglucosamine 2-epimerase (non-hydrolyzing) [Clostridium sp. CM028]|uniref:non-hydrolyzing UDP-N-acetylglucosamine 2-epimerase n=1 Tax=Clostridium sp. CM028 TaxID=2851575 RepID=UPI001C6E3C60|nr:UDP-N-acetylglucosamine 2-epimerase (non-hydrolyzing) [Clostridium sp. CM028]MBW9149710.1 UDP-N-acetylglucosamine 2-epimerase (non-hydrolyzing) [Clostridium sp. CM028]WLC60480.1 UDP-N-acetylglucosamine 2-epimerase (non-hydrolyzing) [Clostridium sp. CM028]
MENIKVIVIFGTRPEAIKMAPLIKELEKNSQIQCTVCVTAQHREILDQVLEIFDIVPQYDLNIMKAKQSLTGITCSVLQGLEEIFEKEQPDIVLVHGDTTTTFAASLAAFYRKIPVGHVEAGLRSHNKFFPYPEEINRKLTGALADLHFAPTTTSKENLLREGIEGSTIFVTGNTVIDAMKFTIKEKYIFENCELNEIDYENRKVIMVTAHRRENWGIGIENICNALRIVVEENRNVEVLYLVHPNPVVKDTVYSILKGVSRIHLLQPIDTKEIHNLIKKCYLVMTDSGGIQEEAPHLGKPVLVLRQVTERVEAQHAGTVRLVGTDIDKIVLHANNLLRNADEYNHMSNSINPYGDGNASAKIVDELVNYFDKDKT